VGFGSTTVLPIAIVICSVSLDRLDCGIRGPAVRHVRGAGHVDSERARGVSLSTAGLTIPDTLVSNDPDEIKEFIARRGGMAAHKVLELASWKASNADYYACYTSVLTAFWEVPKNALMRSCRSIHLKNSSTFQRQR
jgi:hypothetical protein